MFRLTFAINRAMIILYKERSFIMIYDFTFHNPTKIYFGKSALDNLSAELKQTRIIRT